MKTKLLFIVGLAALSAGAFAADKTINDLTETHTSRQWIETADPAIATCGSPANHPCSRKADTLQAVWSSPNFVATAPAPAQANGDAVGTGIAITASNAVSGSSTHAGAAGGPIVLTAGDSLSTYGTSITIHPGYNVDYGAGNLLIDRSSADPNINAGIAFASFAGGRNYTYRFSLSGVGPDEIDRVGISSNGVPHWMAGVDRVHTARAVMLTATTPLCWTSGDNWTTECDTSISRLADSSIGIGDGAGGTTNGTLSLGTLVFKPSAGSQPDCDASTRGQVWFDRGGTGFADVFEVCGKNAADAYAWVAVASF